jgi:hypothetical protein
MKLCLGAAIGLYTVGVLWTHGGAQPMISPMSTMSACYQIAPSGEGFPQVYCPLEGHAYYRDMDGTDGAYGTQGDGEWKALP